jgi:D-aspartate ligase
MTDQSTAAELIDAQRTLAEPTGRAAPVESAQVKAADIRGNQLKALLLGGAHGAIALARVLKRHGVQVWLVTDDTPLPRFSNAIAGTIRWDGPKAPDALERLEQLAIERDLQGAILIPAADADVRFVSEAYERLSRLFDVLLPSWDQLRFACDKALAYRRASELGIAVPRIYDIGSLADAENAGLQYPVVLKPTMRLSRNRFTTEKAWRVDSWEQLVSLYEEANRLVGAENIVVQELVPGDGTTQLSYAALWHNGEPVSAFTACRLRQYPVVFSYTSTYVETCEAPDVVVASETFLRSIRHHGLVEIEYKRDARTGALKLLDINPRPWSWFALADAAGVDFGAAILDARQGQAITVPAVRPGVGWMFVVRDLVASLQTWRHGTLTVGQYLRSLPRTRALATFSPADPLPALLEIPLTLWRVVARKLGG